MTGWKRWALALFTLVAGAAVIILAWRSPEGLRSAASIGGLIAALTPLVLGLVVWARRPSPVAIATSTPEQTDAAQRQLVSQILGQWRDEIALRQLDDPGPLAVRWRFTELDVVDRAEHIAHGNPLHALFGRGRHRFTGRSDRVDEMVGEFRKLKRRRLVILGEAGMGKTTLALLLLRELLEHADPHDPVPVLLSMADWDPGTESLPEWLTRRLTEDYPALRATIFGPDAARALVTGRRILPVLDGLDELPDEVRPRILVRLNEVAADPLVLTCRTVEYQTAVTAPGGDALTGGAVIEPTPLTPADATRYITGCLPPQAGNAWQRLLAMLKDGKDTPVAAALSTPLALWLLRKVYIDTRADPAELYDTSRIPTADAIVEHLLDHLVDALISVNPARGDDEHPFRPRHAWNPVDAERWLTFLAHHLHATGSRDLAWWRLHHVAPRRVAVAAGLVAGVVLGLTVVLAEGLLVGLVNGLLLGPLLGLVFGFVVGLAKGLTVGHVLGLVLGFNLLGAGVGAGLVGGEPMLGLAFAVVGGTPVVVIAVLAARSTPTDMPAYADLRLRGRVRLLARKLTSWTGGRLVLRFVPGFAIGLMYGAVLGLADEVSNGLLAGLAYGLVYGLTAWLAVGLIDWAETPVNDDRPQTPITTFRRDLGLVLTKSLAGGLALGVVFWFQDTSTSALATGLTIGVLVTVSIALGVGLHQPSGRYLVTVSVLRARQQIPLRLLSFLDDTHRLGILRQTGSVYQFRHAKLQDRLAQKQKPTRPDTAPSVVTTEVGR